MNQQKNSNNIFVAIGVMSALIFLADYLTPLGVAVWVLYLLPVALCVMQAHARLPFAVALMETALMVVGFFVSSSSVAASLAVTNRCFGVVAMGGVALLAHQVIRARQKSRRLLWLQQGQAVTAVSMVGEQELNQVADNFLRSTAVYLDAQIGLLYRLEHGRLVPAAAYAHAHDCGAGGAERVPPNLAPGLAFGMAGEVAMSGKPALLREVPPAYLRYGSLSGSAAPRTVLIAPISVEGKVTGVLELGFSQDRGDCADELELLQSGAESAGIALRSASYRQHLRELLEETQKQGEQLQTQQEELRVSNEELEEQGRVLRESQQRLESQQAELEQSNVQLEEQAQRLEAQKLQLLHAHHSVELRSTELERASRYKSEFLANMSHELRTPLNSSLILSQILGENRGGGLTAEEVEYARTIHASNTDLLTLINDILDLSKIEAGHANIEAQPVSLTAVAEALRSGFDVLARVKGLAFRIEVEAGTPAQLVSDQQRLLQILKNLLSNAFKFTHSGEVVLQVSRAGPGRLAFAVRDTGIGIGAQQLHIIFDAFRQADGSTSRQYGGTGLGLSISRELARLLGGAIGVASVEGGGSTFTLEIAQHLVATAPEAAPNTAPNIASNTASKTASDSVPESMPHTAALAPSHVRAPAGAAALAPEPPTPPAADDDRNARHRERLILVIEDDPRFSGVLYQLAHELGFDCIVSAMGGEALRLAREHRPSGILLDVGLPDQSGLAVLERLKRDPATRHIPVHMMSGEDHMQTALEMGAVGYALKPVAREELVAAIARLEEQLQTRARRVLVVEDDAVLRENIKLLLAADDIDISTAGSIAEALHCVAATNFDCMVMDLTLPDGSGYELLEHISTGGKYAFPPVIVYTGRALSRTEEQALQRYSKSIIIKGAKSPERLLDEVSLFLHRVEASLPQDQQRLLSQARQRDSLFEGRHILLAEDDVRNIFALTSIFEPLGASLIIARNGREALAQLERHPEVDLVLMDLMMPEMDGLAAMRALRLRAEWTRLPVIALTAKAMADDRRNCLEAGANDYIAKPIDVDKLVSLCRVWMPKG